MHENEISRIVVDAAIEVQRHFGGPGLLESVYEEALAVELQERGVTVQRQVPIEVEYKGRPLANDLRIDLVAENRVVIECMATTRYNTIFESQALTYLRLSKRHLALVINFGQIPVRKGIHRVVNALQTQPQSSGLAPQRVRSTLR